MLSCEQKNFDDAIGFAKSYQKGSLTQLPSGDVDIVGDRVAFAGVGSPTVSRFRLLEITGFCTIV